MKLKYVIDRYEGIVQKPHLSGIEKEGPVLIDAIKYVKKSAISA